MKKSSLYALCHGRKFERRISPPVLTTISGSGIPLVHRLFLMTSSVISPLYSLSVLHKAVISVLPPYERQSASVLVKDFVSSSSSRIPF